MGRVGLYIQSRPEVIWSEPDLLYPLGCLFSHCSLPWDSELRARSGTRRRNKPGVERGGPEEGDSPAADAHSGERGEQHQPSLLALPSQTDFSGYPPHHSSHILLPCLKVTVELSWQRNKKGLCIICYIKCLKPTLGWP